MKKPSIIICLVCNQYHCSSCGHDCKVPENIQEEVTKRFYNGEHFFDLERKFHLSEDQIEDCLRSYSDQYFHAIEKRLRESDDGGNDE